MCVCVCMRVWPIPENRPRPPTKHYIFIHLHNNRYTATLVNSARSARELLAGSKVSYTNVAFSITLPAGVTVNAYKSFPKLAAAPVYSNATGLVTWQVGGLAPGKRVKLSLKLVAGGSCTTPAPLSLKGTFAYETASGPQTAIACLKKPLYVWTKSCQAIPKPTKPIKAGPGHGKNATHGGGGGNSLNGWAQCVCNDVCKVGPMLELKHALTQ